jgi:hypothetical protein
MGPSASQQTHQRFYLPLRAVSCNAIGFDAAMEL